MAGIAKVVKAAEPDPTQFDPTSKYYDPGSNPTDPRWDWVTVAPVRKLEASCRSTSCARCPSWSNCRLLARGNRLSVMPITDAEFDTIVAYAKRKR